SVFRRQRRVNVAQKEEWTRIREFCANKLDHNKKKYRGLIFKRLVSSLEGGPAAYPTSPKERQTGVSTNNSGETAFQRALVNSKSALMGFDGYEEYISWKDYELPIVFSKRPRRACVDLIGSSERLGTFICELKYKSEGSISGNRADYAIFQALLYYAAVKRDAALLDDNCVYRIQPPTFRWAEIARGKTLLVLGAGAAIWTKARSGENADRVKSLIADVQRTLGVRLIFSVMSSASFAPAHKGNGRYLPAFRGLAEKLPRLSIVDFA
ncbi:MAG TPA: hypothetical protein VGD60_12690, partial [Candidatus Acidoferrales bacterium]